MITLIEAASCWTTPQNGATNISAIAFPRALLLILLLVVGALVLIYGKTLCPSKLIISLTSSPVIAWVLSKVERDPVHQSIKDAKEKPAKDHRLTMDTAEARRWSRDVFLREHSECNFNVPSVRWMLSSAFPFSILRGFLVDFSYKLQLIQAIKYNEA